jgi:predicted nucleic acid-binding protein
MAAPGKKNQFALDTNLLLDLAAGEDFAHTFREVFQENGYALRVTPTVVHELAWAAEHSTEHRELAFRSLSCMREWKIAPFDLVPVGHGLTEEFTRLLIKRGLLPEDEINDGQILTEASLAKIPVLVTSDHHLLDIEEADLLQAFNDRDLMPVRPFHPKNLLRSVNVRR